MKGIFEYDGPLHKSMLMVSKLIILNLLFIIFSLPLITLGASLSSLYSSVNKLSKEDAPSLIKNFIHNFKETLYRGTKLLFILLLVYSLVIVLMKFAMAYNLNIFAFTLMVFFSIILLMTFVIFPIGALYEGDLKIILNNSSVFLRDELMTSIFMFIFSVIFYILIPIYFPRLLLLHLLFGFSLIAFLQTKLVRSRLVK